MTSRLTDERIAEIEDCKGIEQALGEVVTTMSRCFNERLFALSESDIASQWYFEWDDKKSTAWNIYEFLNMLEIHKQRCRRWEEHHNGHCCVVERVRDKYLMPRIKQFEDKLLAEAKALKAEKAQAEAERDVLLHELLKETHSHLCEDPERPCPFDEETEGEYCSNECANADPETCWRKYAQQQAEKELQENPHD